MKRIKECKVSLMEKEKNFEVDQDGRGNYVVRSSGTFLPEEYLDSNPGIRAQIEDEESYMDYVSQAAGLIAEELRTESKDLSVDSVGIWITFDNERMVESSMDLTTLSMMAEHHEDLDPYFEFAKMTLQPFYESEVSE